MIIKNKKSFFIGRYELMVFFQLLYHTYMSKTERVIEMEGRTAHQHRKGFMSCAHKKGATPTGGENENIHHKQEEKRRVMAKSLT